MSIRQRELLDKIEDIEIVTITDAMDSGKYFTDEAGAIDYRKTSPPRAPSWSSSFFLYSNPYFAILHRVHP
ncbi:unnamed protein product [Cuscuta campestris]|uniref:Uncharacterized protein n=1 Tax=Cuscuta campestris TaxID=132261 RepID=A0A484LTC1_9ASTE|nr:unnamed protein product [Cuscuta campestris]